MSITRPDLGGAAVRALAQWRNRPVYITSDTFRGGRCSNGGAPSSIGVSWVVLNSVMTGNKAIGFGGKVAVAGELAGRAGQHPQAGVGIPGNRRWGGVPISGVQPCLTGLLPGGADSV